MARAAFLFAILFLIYFPALDGALLWDDDDYLINNPTLRSFAGLGRIWTEPGSTPQYYPLVFTTFWAEYQVWGLNPLGYHVINVLLHGVNALLLVRVLQKLNFPAAWLAGALFALHPVEVESVAWITERKNVLSLCFALLALLAWLRFAPLNDDAPGGRRWYFLAMLAFTLALCAKTITCSVPAVIVLLVWWKRGWIARDVWFNLAPFFILGLFFALMTMWMERSYVGARGDRWDLAPIDRCLIAGRALCFYVSKLLWPFPLCFNYERWNVDASAPLQYLYPVAVIGWMATLWLGRHRWGRGPITASLLYAGILLPGLGFINIYPMIYSFVADHFQYHASVVFLAAAAWTMNRWLPTPLLQFAAIGFLSALAWLTWSQSSIYKSLDILWPDTLAKNPNSYLALHNMGLRLIQKNEADLAVGFLEKACAIGPTPGISHGGLGQAYLKLGRFEDAEKHLRIAINLVGHEDWPHQTLAALCYNTRRYDEALQLVEKAIALNPNRWQSYHYWGLIYSALERPDDALAAYQKAIDQFERFGDPGSVAYFREKLEGLQKQGKK